MDTVISRPIYVQLAENIKKVIDAGQLGEPGDIITTRSIAREVSLSRDTVSRSLGEVLSRGYVTRKRGRGFIITDRSTAKLPETDVIHIGVVSPLGACTE